MSEYNCENGFVNALGQCVPNSTGTLAAGSYWYTDDAMKKRHEDGELNPCGTFDDDGNYTGLRQGFMVVGRDENNNPIKIDFCAGNLVENHLPDVYLVDNTWKPYLKYVNGAVCLILVLLIVNELRK